MYKGIEWLKEEIGELPCVDTVFNSGGSSYIDSAVPVMAVYDLIDQLDEPEVTLDRAFEEVSKSYPMTKEETWRHLEQIVAHGGKVTYGEPEVLSQEWIDENKFEVNGWNEAVHVEDLQNLLVPKQEIAEEQVMDWLDKNDFYDHITAETVLERAVDKGELNYYGTKYSVIKTPTIPQFVADWHKQNKYYLLSAKFERIADWEDERVVNWYEKCTGRHSNNLANAQETIALMDLVGYEVEEEQKYYVLLGNQLHDDNWTYALTNLGSIEVIEKDVLPEWDRTKLTEQEIKDYDPRYWAFAEPVEEMEE